MPWQRLLSLQVLRSLMADHQLLYVLFTSYDMSIHHDMNAVHDTLSVAVEALKVGTGCWERAAGGVCQQKWNMRAMSCIHMFCGRCGRRAATASHDSGASHKAPALPGPGHL